MRTLSLTVNTVDDISRVTLTGDVEEQPLLSQLPEDLPGRMIALDLDDVERVSSAAFSGLAEWMKRLTGQGKRVYLVDCSPTIVAQLNLAPDLFAAATVISFSAPYFCSRCDRDYLLSVAIGELAGSSPRRAPAVRCPHCGQGAEFDDVESSYFAVVDRMAEAPVDPAALERLRPRQGPHLRGLPLREWESLHFGCGYIQPPSAPGDKESEPGVWTEPALSVSRAVEESLTKRRQRWYWILGVLVGLIALIIAFLFLAR